MKKQDLIAVIVLALIVTTLGVMASNRLFSPPSEGVTLSTEPEAIGPEFNREGIEYLIGDGVNDFTVKVNGLEASKNPTPFGN